MWLSKPTSNSKTNIWRRTFEDEHFIVLETNAFRAGDEHFSSGESRSPGPRSPNGRSAAKTTLME